MPKILAEGGDSDRLMSYETQAIETSRRPTLLPDLYWWHRPKSYYVIKMTWAFSFQALLNVYKTLMNWSDSFVI